MSHVTFPSLALRRRAKDAFERVPWVVATLQRLYKLTRPKFTLGVTGVVLNPQGQVLLVEHVLHPKHPWGLPGGWVDGGETPQQTVARELHEEVGLTVRVGALVHMETFPKLRHIDFAYACSADVYDVPALSPELLDYKWVDLDALPNLDSFQITAITNAREQWEIGIVE